MSTAMKTHCSFVDERADKAIRLMIKSFLIGTIALAIITLCHWLTNCKFCQTLAVIIGITTVVLMVLSFPYAFLSKPVESKPVP